MRSSINAGMAAQVFFALPATIEQNLAIAGQEKHSLPGVGYDAAGRKNTGRIEGQGK